MRVDERERTDRGVRLRAVDQREPFLGPERDRREAGAARACRPRGRTPRRERSAPSPISESARCASGARSPLAPTLPCSGTGGHSPALSIAASSSARSGRAPEYPFVMTFARSSIIARTSRSGSRSPTPGRVAAHEIDLQLGEPVGRDRDVGELAEARGHAVGRPRVVRRGLRRRRGSPRHGCQRSAATDTGARSRATATTWSSVSEFPSRTTSLSMAELRPGPPTIQGSARSRSARLLACYARGLRFNSALPGAV